MPLYSRRASLIIAASAAFVATAPPAQARERVFDISAQPAADGIRVFSRQSGIQVLAAGAVVQGKSTGPVEGRLEVRAALDRLLAGSGITVLSFDGSVVVLAADDTPAGTEAPSPIVVTGSRLPQVQAKSAMPVRRVDMAEAARFGRNSAYDVLIAEPSIAAGIGLGNAFGQGWDAGVSSVSLRNLGANRSLTLIDGMRRVSGSARSSAVDITMIPAAMIERIEVITGGATAIYGADAVTGAINIVTRQKLDRLELSLSQGLAERGDARESTLSLATGTSFADGRGSIAIGGTYSDIAPLDYAQRYRTYLRSVANPANTGANDGIPDQITAPDFRQIYYAYQPSFFFDGRSYLVENGTPRPAAYEQSLYPGQFSYGNGGDGRNLRDADQLRGGLRSLAVIGHVEYSPSDRLTYRAYADFGVSQNRGTASFPRPRDDSRPIWFDGAGGSTARLDNPFLPAGLRRFMLDNGLTTLAIERTFGNFPIMREYHHRHSLTIGQSLEGELGAGMRWSAFQQFGRTTDDVRTTDIPVMSHWLAARDVVADPVTGLPACRDTVARRAGCVPLNVFGDDRPSPALASYVLGTRRERRVNGQQIWGMNASGSPIALPAGRLGLVFGAEYRRETLQTRDDPLARSEFTYGGSGYTVHPDLDAEFDVWELYGEAKAPLLRGRPFAESLDLEGAFRLSKYTAVGTTGTWKLGGTWSPVRGLLLRAMRSRSVRVPNFGELYEVPVQKQAGSITDPCEAADYYQSDTRSANCRALGILVPLGDFKVGPIITTQGNRDLRPETSNSLTLGAVLRPAFLPGAELTIDYWDIGIREAVTQFDYTTILDLCVDLPTIANLFCDAVSRDPSDGRVTAISTQQVNAARMTARGIDLGLSVQRGLGLGRLKLDLQGTYLLRHMVLSMPGFGAGNVRYDGDWEHPRFRGNAQIAWNAGPFGAALNLRFISAGRYAINAESDEVYDRNRLQPYLYADISFSHEIGEALVASFGVRNLSDLRPPQVYPVYKDTTLYDQVGRYLFTTIALRI
ncbi:TonB-dependent receptor [Novosphingobium sp. PS1R-30]|uniref:TonB-dependent receptor n=1 Tax=Novosphingobium anseongense TaxID=3133436 RepID=A0ABU8S119_9SPHN